MKLDLINDLNESTMYRSKQTFRSVTARQAADHAFMDLIALWILFNQFEFAPSAIRYASDTARMNGFTKYIQSGTDLYLSLHLIAAQRSDLLSSVADQVALDRYSVPEGSVIRYLRQLAANRLSEGMVRTTLQQVERALRIEDSNYRSIRRLAQGWPSLDSSQKKLVVTRMLMFYRVHARRSEVYAMLNALAKAKSLEISNARNPEMSMAAKIAAVSAAGAGGFALGWNLGKSVV
jgi:hypothetical protein